jgi:predicted 2-oxoglutarate/Fe(II)-dependent dioxygenase YbiX
MMPSMMPWAVYREMHLSKEQCDHIVHDMTEIKPHKFPGCDATTREPDEVMPNSLIPILNFGRAINDKYFQFQLNSVSAYMQTYLPGDAYRMHTDSTPGQSRKLTAVAILSESTAYKGGLLRMLPWPEYYDIPRSQGTIVVFPAWMLHEVHTVTSGCRQTINMGWWGPSFR